LLSACVHRVMFTLDELASTSDVLFDPNEVDVYYSNGQDGSAGLIDINTQETYEMTLVDGRGVLLSSPSRSMDGHFIYVSNNNSGEVYSLNAYSKTIHKTFKVDRIPARFYTIPEGIFWYFLNKNTKRFISYQQN